ncbi:MAG TPA: nickel-binding protein [Candidatus Limnocylindrales bacterium]|jgi:hypothetical protein
MAEFVVELYQPTAGSSRSLADGRRRARAAAADLSREGLPVRFLRSLFLPGDETCFYLFEAASADVARAAAERAGLAVDRVVQAQSSDG